MHWYFMEDNKAFMTINMSAGHHAKVLSAYTNTQ